MVKTKTGMPLPETVLFNNRARERVQSEAALANELQKEFPGITRTEALKAAKELLDRNNKL